MVCKHNLKNAIVLHLLSRALCVIEIINEHSASINPVTQCGFKSASLHWGTSFCSGEPKVKSRFLTLESVEKQIPNTEDCGAKPKRTRPGHLFNNFVCRKKFIVA